jgi:hypothetical protein
MKEFFFKILSESGDVSTMRVALLVWTIGTYAVWAGLSIAKG